MLASAFLAGALIVSPAAHALALGDVATQSSLGEPLRLTIPVAAQEWELATVCFALGAPNARPRSAVPVVTAKVILERVSSGARLVISDAEPVSDAALKLAVVSSCGSEVRRDYIVLLDPPESRMAGAAPRGASNLGGPGQENAYLPSRAGARTPSTFADNNRNAHAASHTYIVPAIAPPAARASEPAPAPEGIWHKFTSMVSSNFASAISSASAKSSAAPEDPASASADAAHRDNAAHGKSPGDSSRVHVANNTRPASANDAKSPLAAAQQQHDAKPANRAFTARDWLELWPFALGAFGFLLFVSALLLLLREQRRDGDPAWITVAGTSKQTTVPRTLMQGHSLPMTFAHYGALSERSLAPRFDGNAAALSTPAPASTAERERKEPVVDPHSLDTLLGELETDAVAERAIRAAWAAAENDIKSDAILKAIDDAERHHAFNPSGATDALDLGLENDLMRSRRDKTSA